MEVEMKKKLMIQTVIVMMMTFTFIGTGYSLDCPQLITVNTTLESDHHCTGTAIIIGAPDITLDLNGYALKGDGTGIGVENTERCWDGSHWGGCHNVTIKDGFIDGFNTGIKLYRAEGITIEGLEIRNSNEDAIRLDDSSENIIRECVLIGKTKLTYSGIVLGEESDSNEINENLIMKNLIGLDVEADANSNLVTENIFKSNKQHDINDPVHDPPDEYHNIYDENKCKESDPDSICQ